MNTEERLAVIFNNSQDKNECTFNAVALVDYNKIINSFTVKNGKFEKSNERAFNILKGNENFIYGNFDNIKMIDKNSNFSIYIFDNSFIEKLMKEKSIDKNVAYAYIAKKLTQIKIQSTSSKNAVKKALSSKISNIRTTKTNQKVVRDDFVSVKDNENSANISVMTIHQMLYDRGVDEAKAWYDKNAGYEDYNSDRIIEVEFENNEEMDIEGVINSISSKIVGQEEAIKTLVTNIYNNQVLFDEIIDDDGEIDLAELDSRKVSILLDGTTGTGKTAILKEIADSLGLPIEITSANSFSETGYVGPTITDILVNLYQSTDGDLGAAMRGIVVLDEIDKIANDQGFYGKDMKQGVQEELLSFISGGTYNIGDEYDPLLFDTSLLTIIMMGAFTGIRDMKVKEHRSQKIGFAEGIEKKDNTYEVTAQDYVNYGLMREFVGRIKVITTTKTYTVEDLKTILTTSKISPLKNFKKTAKMYGYNNIEFTDDFINTLANQAYKMGTGARGLQTIMAELQSNMLYDLMTNKYDKDEPLLITNDLLEERKKQRRRKI